MFKLRTDPYITEADGVATLNEIAEFHNIRGPSTGREVTVAVMDSGVDDSHPLFTGKDIEQHNFTDTNGSRDAVGHGTAVAGLIQQIAPDAEIISLRIFGDKGQTGVDPIRKAYNWLVENADRVDVANLSWGASRNVKSINEMHQKMLDAGVHDVVAAGNTGNRGGSPATEPRAFSAGATTEDGQMTNFSSTNPNLDNPDVAAIGKNVRLARASGTSMGNVIDENWVKASGTSFSAPITTACVARYLEVADKEPDSAFEEAARDIPQTPDDGSGILDYKAVEKPAPEPPKEPPEPQPPEKAGGYVVPFASKDVLFLDADWLPDGEVVAEKLDTKREGAVVRFREK